MTFFCWIFTFFCSFIDVQFDSGFNWFTLESEHFAIHFPAHGIPGYERMEMVRKVASVAENVRQTLKDNGVNVPEGRVHIVIADYYDCYNGYATPFPTNTIVLLPFFPRDARSNDDDWLRTLILHEFSHICQMDQCHGPLRIPRRIFGRIILPNALLPAWLLEGYAVYNETRFSTMGRLRSVEWRSILNEAVWEKRLLQLDQCNNYQLQRYPAALAPYLYGSSFVSFLARVQGDAIWEEFNYKKSFYLPFVEDRSMKKVFGKFTSSLWSDWKQWLVQQAESLKVEIYRESLTSITQINCGEIHVSSPVWSHSGKSIYFISANTVNTTAIRELELGTMTVRTIREGRIFGSLSVSPDGEHLAFSELIEEGSGYLQGDIFVYAVRRPAVVRLTKGERASDPDFAPDSTRLVYVSNCDGVSRLKVINYRTGEQTVVAELDNQDYFRTPRFSPGGGLVAVSVWRTGGYSDIEILDLKTGWMLPITRDLANDINPWWSRTGKYLYFISDRSGTYNLYAYAVETHELYRCTNILTGVFESSISPDNRIVAFTLLTEEGEELGVAEIRPRQWRRAVSYADTYPDADYSFKPATYELFYYSPLPSVLPKFWLPMLQYSDGWSIGAGTFGWDVLQFHRYYCFAGYQINQRSPMLSFVYELHRYRPIFELRSKLMLRSQQARLGVSLPLVRRQCQQNLGMGLRFNREHKMSMILDGFYNFSNARIFRYNVAPARGRNIVVLADFRSTLLLSPSNLTRFVLVWNEYLGRRSKNWSLKMHFAGAVSAGDTSRRSAFEIGNKPGLLRLRGCPQMTGAGAVICGFECRFPILWVERGLGLVPLFLSNLNGAVFSEGGVVSNKFSSHIDNWDIGAGLEIGTDLVLAHYLPLRLNLGLSTGRINFGKLQVYFGIISQIIDDLFLQNKNLD
ncbi:MAG: hypothetical protein ABIK54_06800 [candidate division WOR-3 bacterium]